MTSPVVSRTVYRIVREALTNVRKHAPGAIVQVLVSYADTQVRVCVHNSAAPGPPVRDLAETGSRLGIANLRQRIELVHGTLLAGPAPDGGFRLEATLPAYVPTAESSTTGESGAAGEPAGVAGAPSADVSGGCLL
jgi:signal transduction histidine kinase